MHLCACVTPSESLTPFLRPPLTQRWALQARFVFLDPITHTGYELRPGASHVSPERVPGKSWHRTTVLFCPVEQNTPVCEEKDTRRGRGKQTTPAAVCSLSPGLSQHLAASLPLFTRRFCILHKVSFLGCS